MGLPRHLSPRDPGSGHGPFGIKAFRGALIGCAVLVVVGLAMVLLGGDAARSVGLSFLVLGVLGPATAGAGLLLERLVGRRPPPPRDARAGNGRGSYPRRATRARRSGSDRSSGTHRARRLP